MITVCIPTIRRFDLLEKAIWSFQQDPSVWGDILVIDNSIGKCPEIPGAQIIVPEEPMCVAASWNWFYKNTNEYTEIVIANDDVEIDGHAVTELVRASRAEKDVSIFFGMNVHKKESIENDFSFFFLRREAYLGIGPFDENFKPAYYEDRDYKRRMDLLGVRSKKVLSANYFHEPSSTVRSYTTEEKKQQDKYHRLNQSYYMGKWGGFPDREKYELPFNGRKS